MSKEISITQGQVTLVDDEDYEYLSQWKWQAEKYLKCYRVFRTQKTGYIKKKKFYMHRVIMNPPDDMEIDHKNRNPLDNRRQNLRIATTTQNMWNRTSTSKSGYRGVKTSGKKYQARIGTGRTYIGTFNTAEEAACAYDEKAKEFYGEFANTNFQSIGVNNEI